MSGAETLARVTIVMTARERLASTMASIESIERHTELPHRFIFAGNQVPAELDTWARPLDGRLEIVRFDAALWPNQIRKRIAPAIATDYVVFIDNDVLVRPGWLERVVACADQTGAGIVCPLYLIGADATATQIHMAGGRLNPIQEAGGIVLQEAHHLMERERSEVAAELKREPCDFAEFHCMLMRSDLAKNPAMFDDTIICVHEHIDAALTAKKLGYTVIFEPSSEVTYVGKAPYRLSDLEFFRARWATAAAESSLKGFAAKWSVIDEERSFGGIRRFVELHRTQVDPLRRSGLDAEARGRPMDAHELKQSLADLYDLAAARAYRQDEWNTVEQAYLLAMALLNGAYRPCGRPFINHLAGTASVLMHYDFKAFVVAAGLLHAAYSHCALLPGGPQASAGAIARLLGGRGGPLERRVRAYTLSAERWQQLLASPSWPSDLTVADGELLAITAANDIDMHLSGEFRFSGRRDMDAANVLAPIAQVSTMLGIPGLGETLRIENERLSRIPVRTESRWRVSFRLAGEKLVAAANGSVTAVLERDEGPLTPGSLP
jgi:Glycosyltransferase like family 2